MTLGALTDYAGGDALHPAARHANISANPGALLMATR